MHVLITGAASGIGLEVSRAFTECGHTVYALDIQPSEPRERCIPFLTDITCEDAVHSVAQALVKDGVTLDAIIHAAGIHAMLSLVEGEYSVMEHLMRVNIFGAMLINRVLHPLLSDRGRIVIITSEVATLAPLPFNGLYSVSKCALDAYAQALRQELQLLGQRVITMRPGAVETPLCRASLDATERLSATTKLYRTQAAHFLAITKRFMGTPMPAAKLASTVYRAVTCRRPRIAYNKHRNPGLVLLGMLPQRWQCAVIRMLLNRRTRTSHNKHK